MPKLKGKQPNFQMGAEHRLKIANSNILSRLLKHATGELPDLSPSERDTGLALLRKVMPDMKPIDADGGTAESVELVVRIGGD